jgi:hypothetical protein
MNDHLAELSELHITWNWSLPNLLWDQTAKQRQESTFDEQMKALQGMRSNLTVRKGILENQIRDLEGRMLEKQQKGIGGDKQQPPKEQ